MHITLDYLVAGLVIIIILTFTATSISPFTSVTLQHVQEEQLNPLAERLLDKVILTPGEPLDWGDIYRYNETSITGFGLGYLKGGFIDPYVLDPDKVSRLADTPFQPLPGRVARLLGLTWDGDPEHLKYGFRLRIVPALNITITPDEGKKLYVHGNEYIYTAFNISVKSYDYFPASNAKVKAIYLAVAVKGGGNNEDVDYHRDYIEVVADWRGECYVDFEDAIKSSDWWGKRSNFNRAMFALIVYAGYSGIKSFEMYEFRSGDILNASIIGNYLIVEFPLSLGGPQGAHFIRGLIQVGENTIAEAELYNPGHGGSEWVINKGNYAYRVYEISGIDPSLNTDVLFVKWIGRPWFSAVRYPPQIDYQVSGVGEGLRVITNHRFCKIGDLTYVVELSVWRMAE